MAQQYLVENCLNTGGAGVTQGLSTSIINVNNDAGGGVIINQADINRTGGAPQNGGSIDFLSIPNASRGKISIIQNTLVFQSGDDGVLSNGTISIPKLTVIDPTFSATLVTPQTTLIGNAVANVYNAFVIQSQPPEALGQGESYELFSSKVIFTYPREEGPNFIQFTSNLFKLGMVFLKDESGLNDLPGVTMELDLEQEPPLLTITNIPVNEDGRCNAMLLVI